MFRQMLYIEDGTVLIFNGIKYRLIEADWYSPLIHLILSRDDKPSDKRYKITVTRNDYIQVFIEPKEAT
jgi:hypothetical protein